MSLETAQYIHQLNSANPSGADKLKDGDDHLRMIKAALLATFPGIKGPLDPSVTHTLLNGVAALLVPIGTICLWSGADSAVPAGWAICDGRSVTSSDGTKTIVTPNLTDRAPTGVNVAGGRPVGTLFGNWTASAVTDAQGQHTHTASTSAAGSHNHGGSVTGTALSVDQIPGHTHLIASPDTGDNATTVQPNGHVAEEKTSDGNSGYRLINSGSTPSRGLTSSTGGGAAHNHAIPTDGVHTHPVTIDANGAHAHNVTVSISQPSIALYFIMKI